MHPNLVIVMPKRKTSERERHDEAVRAIAEELKQNKWDVETNVEGFGNAFKIGKLTPDIVARKGGLRRVCEVVTQKDFEGDRQAYIEFRNYCDEYDFHFYVVDEEGKRREVDPKAIGKK
jgi:hypothetical protein